MPRKIRQLESDLLKAGFTVVKGAGKGSHRKYIHPNVEGFVIISGKAGDDAKLYQEKQVKAKLEESEQP